MSRFNNTSDKLTTDLGNIDVLGEYKIKYIIDEEYLSDGKIKTSLIPAIPVGEYTFVVSDISAMNALTAMVQGNLCLVTNTSQTFVYHNETWLELLSNQTLAGLSDTAITNPVPYNFLGYFAGAWINVMFSSYMISNFISTTYQTNHVWIFDGGNWIHRYLLLSDIPDLNITAPSDNQLLKYDSGSGKWINYTHNYADDTTLINHINDLSIHRQIGGEATLGYVPIGNGSEYVSTLLDMNALADVSLTNLYSGSSLKYDGLSWVDTLADNINFVFSSRALNNADEGMVLYITGDVIINIPTGLNWEIGSKCVLQGSGRTILVTDEGVLINGKFDEIHSRRIVLHCSAADTYLCWYDDDESSMYKNVVSAPVLGYNVNTSYPVEHTSIDMNYILFSYTVSSDRRYVSYNINTNSVENHTNTTGYPFGTDILNVNNTNFYACEFVSPNIRMVSSDDRYNTNTITALSTQCKTCSNRLLYDSSTQEIVIPFVNTFDKFYIATCSLDLLTIAEVDCVAVLAGSIKVICGWHYNRGVIIVENNTNYLRILIGGDTFSFMNNPNTTPIDFQLQGDEYLEECRSTAKGNTFYFMTRDSTSYNIWSLNDVFDGAMRLLNIPYVNSASMYQPSLIRDNILYLIYNSNNDTNTRLVGCMKISISDFKVSRDSNVLELGNNTKYTGFLLRRDYGMSCIGLPYNNTFDNILYKAIV